MQHQTVLALAQWHSRVVDCQSELKRVCGKRFFLLELSENMGNTGCVCYGVNRARDGRIHLHSFIYRYGQKQAGLKHQQTDMAQARKENNPNLIRLRQTVFRRARQTGNPTDKQ